MKFNNKKVIRGASYPQHIFQAIQYHYLTKKKQKNKKKNIAT